MATFRLFVFLCILAFAFDAYATPSKDSALVHFFKRAYESDSSPDALTFREALSPDGVYYTNGNHLEYNTYAAINKAFNDAYRNIKITYSQIVEVPNVNGTKINGTYAEGNVGARIHWQGDYVLGGPREEFHSHALLTIKVINGTQIATTAFEVVDYKDIHHLTS